jgi:hypothetical protein
MMAPEQAEGGSMDHRLFKDGCGTVTVDLTCNYLYW